MGEAATRAVKKSHREENGYLTVFLALSLTVILSLFLTLIEAARMNAVKMQIECACNVASDSVLAEFSKELYKQYDLLFIDTSYGGANPSVENTEKHFKTYLDENFKREGGLGTLRDFTFLTADSVRIEETRFAADDNYRALREQVYAYMSADPAGSIAAPLLARANSFRGLEMRGFEVEKQRRETVDQLRDSIENKDQRAAQKEQGADLTREVETAQDRDDGQAMIQSMGSFMETPLLYQILGGRAEISSNSVQTGALFSHRGFHVGDGLEVEDSHHYPMADELTFDEYLLAKCGDKVTQRDDSALKYELEYIIAGTEKDNLNLEKTAFRIFMARYASNFICLSSDSTRRSQASAVAGAVTFLFPEAEKAVEALILFAWSYLESIRDLQILFAGGGVPLIKTSSQWNTKITDMLHPWSLKNRQVTSSPSLQTPGYEDYLRMILLLENASVKNRRFMDICEMNIRQTKGNEQFRMDWCMDSFSYTAGAESTFGYHFIKKRAVSYN